MLLNKKNVFTVFSYDRNYKEQKGMSSTMLYTCSLVGEVMTQCIRTLAAIPLDTDSVPRPHTVDKNCL